MQENIPYPGPAFRSAVSFSPPNEVARLGTSENSVTCQWWRAMPNPAYDETSAQSDNPATGAFLLVQQTGGPYQAVMAGARVVRQIFPQGTWEGSEILLTYDYQSFPLSIYDQIILGSGATDGRSFTRKETVTRGYTTAELTGTFATNGTAVTGTGTNFTTSVVPGQILTLNGESQIVTAVASDTALTVAAAYSQSYSNMDGQIGSEMLQYWPALTLISVVTTTQSYVVGTDVGLSADGTTLVWLKPSTAPAPATRLALIYDYMPRYQVTEFGIKGQVVNGVRTMDVVALSLWKPQVNQNA